jgi:putative membrane protein
MTLVFLIVRYTMAIMPLRLALTPRGTRRRRVRRRALELFKVGTEKRTTGRTGILIYLSMGERMAEIVADEAIHSRVPDTEWGEAMAAMIEHVATGRVADGMIAAVERVGVILSGHLPRAADDRNELPDRVIEL